MVDHYKFPSIGSFAQFVEGSRYHANNIGVPLETLTAIPFIGRPKLHGTNAAVQVTPTNEIYAQSRDNILSLVLDNAGFNTFVKQADSKMWIDIVDQIATLNGIDERQAPLIVFGEWCGGSIQSGTALSQCPKHFVIFCAQYGEEILQTTGDAGFQFNDQLVYNINQGPAIEVLVDYADLYSVSDLLNGFTEQADAECPWTLAMFQVSGVGEGWVWMPKGVRAATSKMWFKTKGNNHKVRGVKHAAPVDPEKVTSITECVGIVLTVNRMEQMVYDHKIPLKRESTGVFLKAVAADICKEEQLVMEANGLSWKDIGKLVQSNARIWFLDQVTQNILNG